MRGKFANAIDTIRLVNTHAFVLYIHALFMHLYCICTRGCESVGFFAARLQKNCSDQTYSCLLSERLAYLGIMGPIKGLL